MQEQNRQLQKDLNRACNQAAQDSGTIQQLNARITELEQLVEKQKATISNQSRSIRTPKLKKAKFRKHRASTPAMYPATPQYQTPMATRQSSAVASPPPYHAPSYQTPSQMVNQYPRLSVYDQAPPKFDISVNSMMPMPMAPVQFIRTTESMQPFGYDLFVYP